ncbi:MAG: DUF2306 domain-containing protein [Pseudomonadota bacterium]
MPSRTRRLSQYLYFVCAFTIASYALSYYWHSDNPFNLRYHQLNALGIYSHFIGAGFALLFGAVQMFTYPGSSWHRRLGYAYCLAVILGAIGGYYLSFHSHLGMVTGLGFFIVNSLWVSFLYLAIRCVLDGDLRAHRRWMLRSMALTSAGISLRILLPLLGIFFSFDTSYLIVSWLSWIPNLVVMEIYFYVSSAGFVTKPVTHISSTKGI